MKERVWTSLFALAALILLVAAMFGGRAPDDGYRPITAEENVSGLAVLYRWLDEGGVPVGTTESDWFDLLTVPSETPEASATPLGGGDVLLVHTPLRRFLKFDEREALFDWVRAGNRLVVSDFGNEEFAPSRVSSVEGLRRFAPGLVIEDKAASGPLIWAMPPDPFATVPDWVLALGGLEDRLLLPAGRHPFTEDVAGIAVIGDLHGHVWQQSSEYGVPWQPLLVDAASGSEVAWTRALGEGEIVVTVHPSIFSNGAIDREDNARLAAALLTPTGDGELLIDDYHQIEGALGAGGRLLTDGRFHATVAVVLLFWLLWLLADDGAWDRKVLPKPVPERRRADLVRAAGGFLARHMDQGTAADRLLDPVRRRLAERHGVPVSGALDRLGDEAALNPERRKLWEETLERIRRGRRVSLTKVRMMTVDMLEQLA
ncbi:MAG: DUF4350 domain-containing protein [Pseudomonadota bacterium]|nr:DUF4350 domain-containing protein [Pseudomonadota bacterium]